MTAGRNDPCPCSSGKKSKHCCLDKESSGPVARAARFRRLQEPLERSLAEFAFDTHGGGIVARAERAFAGERTDIGRDSPEVQLFWPWFFYDWRPAPEGDFDLAMPDGPPTIGGAYLAEGAACVTNGEREFLEAVLRSPFSFHDVLQVRIGQGLRLRDIVLETEVEVIERSGSKSLEPGDVLFGRVVSFGDFGLLVGSGSMPIPPIMKESILDLRRTLRSEGAVTPSFLQTLLPLLNGLYFDMRERLMNPPRPKLHNTDGDPFLLHTIHYEVPSARGAFDALRRLAGTTNDEEMLEEAKFGEGGDLVSVTIPWSRRGNRLHKSWERTILGQLQIEGTNLTVSVNSARRARKISSEIEKRLGEGARHMRTEIRTPEDLIAPPKTEEDRAERERLSREHEELNARPEIQEAMRALADKHWKSWLKEPIPALGGKSPSQAVKTPEGREMVEALLVHYERQDRNRKGHLFAADYARLRRQLGLGRPGSQVEHRT